MYEENLFKGGLLLILISFHTNCFLQQVHGKEKQQQRQKQNKKTCIFLDRESHLFYQQCNARDVENSKPIGHRITIPRQQLEKFACFTSNATRVTYSTRNRLDTVQQPCQFQVQSAVKVHFDCRRRQRPSDPFPLEISISEARRLY